MIGQIVSFLLNAIGYGGYTGIILLMFLESSFFPFPSEVVVPPAAYLASKGKMDLYLIIASASFGSLIGALFNYWLSLKLGYSFLEKYGKYVFLSKKSLDKVCEFFNDHGEISTFIGRLLPGIRQYISLPAGMAKMNIFTFSLFTLLGACLWVSILAFIGYSVGNNMALVKYMLHKAYIYIFIFSAVLVSIYIVVKRRKNDKRI